LPTPRSAARTFLRRISLREFRSAEMSTGGRSTTSSSFRFAALRESHDPYGGRRRSGGAQGVHPRRGGRWASRASHSPSRTGKGPEPWHDGPARGGAMETGAAGRRSERASRRGPIRSD
jgi:hypothetical protein